MSRSHSVRSEEGEPANHLKRQECLRVLLVNVKRVAVQNCKVTSLQSLVRSALHNCFGRVMALGNQEGAGFPRWDQKKETATVHDIGM